MSAKATLLSTIGIGFVLQATPGAAQVSEQSGKPAGRAEATANLEEIIVTARKREESILDVPVIATVLTQEALELTKIDDFYALATRVPSLLLGNAVNSSGTQVSMRGVGTTALNATMDQSVSLNVDGLPLSQGVAYGVGMFDVARVEVLKGPQALFFGKNNTAGVISLRSADPTDEVEIDTRAAYEVEAEEKEVELILSGPVTDSLKLRLASRFSDQEGFFRNEAVATPGLGARTPTDKDYASAENLIVRGTALFEPSDKFAARLKLAYNDYRMDGGSSPLQIALCPDGTAGVPPINIAFIAGDDCTVDEALRIPLPDPAAFPAGLPNGAVQFEDNVQTLASLELNMSPSESLTVTSVTGYYDDDFTTAHSGSTTGTTVPFVNNITFDNQQLTEELRLTSDYADKPVNFMVGAFYLDGQQRNEVRIPANQQLGFPLPLVLIHVVHDIDIRSSSLFGQLMWDVTPQLELAAGARWTDEKREHAQFNLNPGQGAVGPVARLDPELNPSNVSPELTITYKPTDHLTAFASYKTGFKSGSFTSQTFVPPTQPASFDDEEAKGGDAGIKASLLDGRLITNLAAYYYDYTDLQVGALELNQLPSGQFVFAVRTLNAGTANVRGIDFDVNYSPAEIDGLTLTAAVNYNRARYDSFANAPCGNGQTISQGCDQLFNPTSGRFLAQDLSGRRLVRAPDWAGYFGFNHAMSVGGDKTLDFGAGAIYTSEYSTALVDLPGYEQDEFVKFDANVALRGGAWELALMGRNLTDELVRGWCVNSNVQNGTVFGGQVSGAATGGPAGQDEAACMIERGREVWARLSWRF